MLDLRFFGANGFFFNGTKRSFSPFAGNVGVAVDVVQSACKDFLQNWFSIWRHEENCVWLKKGRLFSIQTVL